MNKQSIIVWIVLSLFLLAYAGCSSSSPYDAGYEKGYDGAEKGVAYSFSKEYKNGYDDGAQDAYYFDLGYRDARNDEEPRYPSLEEYMEGYREGK